MKMTASSLSGALLVSLVTFTLGVTSSGLVAQEATVDDTSEFGERRQQRRDNTLERFDRNDDGKLGGRERAAMKDKRQEFREGIDKNNDGEISKRERRHAKKDAKGRKRGKRRFEWADKNDDGELSRQERRRAHKRFHSDDKKAAR